MVDGHIGFEAAHVVDAKALPEEAFAEVSGSIKFVRNLFLPVTPGVETRTRIQSMEIGMTTDVVPVRMGNKDCCQFRKARRVSAQRLVGGFGRIRPRPSIDAN